MCLATVLVGDDRPCQIYVRMKHKKAAEAGMLSKGSSCPDSVAGRGRSVVGELAADPSVHGILVQLPLPDGLDPEPVLATGAAGEGRRRADRALDGPSRAGPPGHVPCTPLGVMRLLDRYGVADSRQRAVVVGRSTLVGLPVLLLLGRKGTDATVDARPFAHA